jgi:hypothetical protein
LRIHFAGVTTAIIASALAATAQAQQPAQPLSLPQTQNG